MYYVKVPKLAFYLVAKLNALKVKRIKDNCTINWSMLNQCYLSRDLKSGFNITYKCELNSVFSLVRGRGESIVSTAVSYGADNLNCFDGYLVKLYESSGFRICSREPNWTPGEPDIIYMTI